MRKPDQIAASNGRVFVRADDGTLWVRDDSEVSNWQRVLPLPQFPLPESSASPQSPDEQ